MESQLENNYEANPEDKSHLDSLSIAHYVVGAIGILFACFPLIHMFLGLAFITGADNFMKQGDAPPDMFGWLFFLMGLVFFLAGQAMAISIIVSGRYLKQRRNYMFTFIVACINCVFFPFGTVLGVFTIIVLSRDSVKKLYGLM